MSLPNIPFVVATAAALPVAPPSVRRLEEAPDLVALVSPYCVPPTDAMGQRQVEQGYAWPLESYQPLLAFTDVEPHTDGSGWTVLTLVSGPGLFFLGNDEVALVPGQTIVFDDRLEHGFETTELGQLSYAVTASLGEVCPSDAEALAALREACAIYASPVLRASTRRIKM